MKSPNKCLQSARSAPFWRDRFAAFERESSEQSRRKQINQALFKGNGT